MLKPPNRRGIPGDAVIVFDDSCTLLFDCIEPLAAAIVERSSRTLLATMRPSTSATTEEKPGCDNSLVKI
jgi:hypothetical protein